MVLKLIFDKIASFFGLLVFAPLLIFVYILIRVKMPDGSPIFTQTRVGKGGKLFRMFKFRTMYASNTGGVISVRGDKRITPLGAILRKFKLDELPELWNVLIGDMSFVGPRPDVPGYADKLVGKSRRILELRPGITGPASLKYRNEEELLQAVSDVKEFNDTVLFPDKVRINLEYLENRNFLLDVKIILRTLFA